MPLPRKPSSVPPADPTSAAANVGRAVEGQPLATSCETLRESAGAAPVSNAAAGATPCSELQDVFTLTAHGVASSHPPAAPCKRSRTAQDIRLAPASVLCPTQRTAQPSPAAPSCRAASGRSDPENGCGSWVAASCSPWWQTTPGSGPLRGTVERELQQASRRSTTSRGGLARCLLASPLRVYALSILHMHSCAFSAQISACMLCYVRASAYALLSRAPQDRCRGLRGTVTPV